MRAMAIDEARAVGVNPVDYKIVRGYMKDAMACHFPLVPCWDLAGVVKTASDKNHDYLRSLGAEPVAHDDGLASAVRSLVPDGVDAVIDLVGGDTLALTPELLADGGRVASIVDADAVHELGGRYEFVHPCRAGLEELGRLADEGRLRVEIAATVAFEQTADAFAQVEERHTRGKVVVTFS